MAVSHYRMLKQFAESEGGPSDLMIVAEDDAVLSSDFERIVKRVSQRLRTLDFVVLADPFSDAGVSRLRGVGERHAQLSFASKLVGVSRVSGTPYRVGHYDGHLWGTGLYLVSRAASVRYVRLVQRLGGIHWVADDYGYWKGPAQVDVKLLRPNLAG